MKTWMWAALALGLVALPLDAALARGGRGGGGRSMGAGRAGAKSPRAAARTTKKGQAKMIERLQEQNREAILADAARDRV